MRFTPFPGSSGSRDTAVSALGFGCAGLLGRASRQQSLTALGTAFDAGITFFDNARSYGYGASEGLLGEFLGRRRDKVILCTKFGILPAARNWKQRLMPVARAAVRAVPALRKAAQRQAAAQFQEGAFTLENLRTSFETSLRELRTDYVDILLLHAAPASVLAQHDLLEALGRLVEQGKLRLAGISGELSVIAETFTQRPQQLRTAQFALNLNNIGFTTQTRQHKDLFLVANHPFGGPTGVQGTLERITALAASETLDEDLREKLAGHDPQLLPELVFNAILNGTGVSAVIPAMLQPTHIHSNIRAVEHCRFTPDELALLRSTLATA